LGRLGGVISLDTVHCNRNRHYDDPVLRAAALAPYDDEPETDDERVGVLEARAEAARGELVDDEDLTL